MSQWYRPAGSTATHGFATVIAPGPGWENTGLRVAELGASDVVTLDTGPFEYLVLPLSGGCQVTVSTPDDERAFVLNGRPDVYTSASDLVYVPGRARLRISVDAPAKVALPFARAATTRPAYRLAAADVPEELRGAGRCSRLVRNFGIPGVLDAESLIACEVITPAGNWSSYPPHKHDQDRPGLESALEEIYYFDLRTAGGGNQGEPFGYQRVYGTPERPIEVLAEVRSGDVVLVPHGWHGPAIAPPGYDMYYLNVMAGPGAERAWLICDDPAHSWVRGTWDDQPVDPRLPFRPSRTDEL